MRSNALILSLIVAGFCTLAQCCKSQCCNDDSDDSDGTLFYEEFDTFDLNVWQHEITAGGGGNNEFQYYTNNRTNSYVRDGILYIKPTLTEDKYDADFVKYGTLSLQGSSPANTCTGAAWYGCEKSANYDNGYIINPVQSARIRTVNSFSMRYGRVEIEAQMPAGDWLWPGIWMLPTRNAYGDWPASGEIDIVESIGNMDLTDSEGNLIGAQVVGSTMHWGPFWPWNAWEKTHGKKRLEGKSFADDFHKYVLDWTPTGLRYYVDGEQIMEAAPPAGSTMYDWGEFESKTNGGNNPWLEGSALAPFDQEFYLILNVAVGGTTGFFQDNVNNGPGDKPWTNDSPTAAKDFWDKKDLWYPTWRGEDAALKVKYVKVTKYDEEN